MTIEHTLLSHTPALLPVVAQWYFSEWGRHVPGLGLADECQRLEVFLHDAELPLLLIAMDQGEPVAAAQLKFHERTERPEREHWLGGVYVQASHRGQGLAALLIDDLMARAAALGVREVYLQTQADDGGLYRRLGWEPLESVQHAGGFPVRIMRRTLAPR
ncbi:GNAT family N-acetyltransferase [Stenotrophomonas rhizophila]|uniref:GNAT family N-acetyltransferase n=1 Tax=Stenotrophomonas rhizophila TaxID=216778 RepID=UPI001E30DB7C|nr:GNAT family N-acetyltransferase [Stenotrophomonas rhizophila]MCC7633474.1 GNAT family N-acetyltransferase [Stenotrophomonas rhizophila]MCC7663041.1 GNAT family N-acetyltransferase [Stenotrophomonas rhizophila]